MTLSLSQKLLAWYAKHHRLLPWRISPDMQARGQKPNPYHVWLSEVMLQQTTVATVKNYYDKFITYWPDIDALGRAPLEDILKNWSGLGYYARARNLKACAEMVVTRHQGIFPQDYQALRRLPGIGDYTACAIMAIAYSQPFPAVDGNIERIISRLFALALPPPALKKEVRNKMAQLMPQTKTGDFIQAMMDLGSLVCSPKSPDCPSCPFHQDCLAHAKGTPTFFPVKIPKKPKPLRQGAAFVARSKKGRILLQKRQAKGLLASMSEVPNFFDEHKTREDLDGAPFHGDWRHQGKIVHIFTHFRLEMTVYLLGDLEEACCPNGWWVAESQIQSQALPTVMKKVLVKALPTIFKTRP